MNETILRKLKASAKANCRCLLTITFFALPVCHGFAQENTAGELAAKCVQNYTEVWHKHDPKAIASMYSEDARFEDEYGEVHQGRVSIQELFAESSGTSEGAKLTVTVDSARMLGKDVLIIRGTSTVTQGDEASDSEFTATLVKSGEKWLIADVSEKSLVAQTVAADELSKLQALIGTWRPEGDDAKFEATAKMSLNGAFLTRKTKSLGDGEDNFTSVEVIGYDPVNDHLKSWFFDSEGGFGEGYWRQEGDKWVVHRKVTMPDGGMFSSEYHLEWGDGDHITVATISKSLNGQVLPNAEPIKIKRVGSAEDDLNLNKE